MIEIGVEEEVWMLMLRDVFSIRNQIVNSEAKKVRCGS